MTPQQMTILVTALRASANPDVQKWLAPATSDAQSLVEWCNAKASPAVACWRNVSKTDIFKVWDPSELDNVSSAAKRETLWNLLDQEGGLNCSVATGPKIVTDLFPQASSSTSRAAILAVAHEEATNAEALIGAGSSPAWVTVTSATPNNVAAKVRPWAGTLAMTELTAGLRANP